MSKKSMKQFNERKNVQTMQSTQPPKKVKKREVEAWILAIFMIAWTVCSVLGTIGFCRTQASADSVPENAIVQSDSDEIAVEYSTAKAINRPKVMADVIEGVDSFYFSLPLFNTLIFSDEFNISVFAGSFYINLTYGTFSLIYDSTEGVISFDLLDESTNPIYYQYVDDLGAYNTGYVTVYCLSSPYFSATAEMISIIPDIRDYYPHSYNVDAVFYDDMNGGTVFEIALRFAHRSMQNIFSTYYLIIDTSFVESNNLYSLSSSQFLPTDYYPILGLSYSSIDTNYYQEYFNQGKQEGQSIGEKIGFDNGYDKGKADGQSIGEKIGFENGKIYGINHANEYTFSGLLGSVVDVPVTAIFGSVDPDTGQRIGGLLNFNILGVDLTGFFMSLLSVMIILSVVKLILP